MDTKYTMTYQALKVTSTHFFWFAVGVTALNGILGLLVLFFAEGNAQAIGLVTVIAKGFIELAAYVLSQAKINRMVR